MLVSAIFSEQIAGLSIQVVAKAEFASRKNTSPRKKVSFAVKEAWRGVVKKPGLCSLLLYQGIYWHGFSNIFSLIYI